MQQYHHYESHSSHRLPLQDEISQMKPKQSKTVYKDQFEIPLSNNEYEQYQAHRSHLSKRSKSVRNIPNYDPLTADGYHEYNGSIYEPVSNFDSNNYGLYNTSTNLGNYNAHNSSNFGNFDAHSYKNVHSSPITDYDSHHKNYHTSYSSNTKGDMIVDHLQ